MKKVIAVAVVAFVTAALTPFASALPGDDVNGPSCANVIGGTGGYSGNTVGINILTESATCAAFTYSLIALDEAGSSVVVGRVDVSGDGQASSADGTDLTLLAATVNDDDSTICVYVETSVGGGNHVFDRAPDADAAQTCEVLSNGSGGQFGGFS